MTDNAKELLRVSVYDRKYTVVQTTDGLSALRYEEPWRDCLGDGLILALAQEVQDLRERLSARQQASVEEVARTLDPSAFVDLGPGFKRAQKIEMELVTLKARALLAKYDIFQKVEG
jgi:hypothetical protein